MQNDDGAFCWRDECKKCLSTTKAVQETAEAIALVAELYDANVSRIDRAHPSVKADALRL